VVNNGRESKSATIIVTCRNFVSRRFTVRDIQSDKKRVISSSAMPTFSIEVPKKNGTVLELSLFR